MFFTKKDRKYIEKMDYDINMQFNCLERRIESIQEGLDNIPDVANFAKNLRGLVENQEKNMKSCQEMMLELKGVISQFRAEIKKNSK